MLFKDNRDYPFFRGIRWVSYREPKIIQQKMTVVEVLIYQNHTVTRLSKPYFNTNTYVGAWLDANLIKPDLKTSRNKHSP